MPRGALGSVALMAVVLVAVAAVGPAGAHAPADGAGYEPGADVRVSYEVSLADDDGAVAVTASADIPSNVEQFEFTPPDGAAVSAADGFEAGDDHYDWDGESDRPALSYRVDASTDTERQNVASGAGWVVARTHVVTGGARWLYAGDEPGFHQTVELRDGSRGYVGHRVFLLGEHEALEAARGGATLRILVPDGATMRADRTAAFDAIGFARRHLDVGHRHETVTAIVFSTRLRVDGFAGSGAPEFAIQEEARPQGVDNVWLHEYVHTRQNFTTAADLAWILEGTAEYEAALLSLQQGSATWRDFRRTATVDEFPDADLREPVSGGLPLAHYDKGAAVVAALDADIRRATDGERTFAAVLRRMNDRRDRIDSNDFKAIVERVAGESFRVRIDEMVTGEFDPAPPADPYVFATGPAADDDGDGLTTAEEREAGSNPFAVDTDDDGLDDGVEVDEHGTDPDAHDSDLDRLLDAEEVEEYGTDPTDPDTDGDGVDDGAEVDRGTDPTVADGGGGGDGTDRDETTATASAETDSAADGAGSGTATSSEGTATDGATSPVGLGAILAGALALGAAARVVARRG